MILLFGPNGYIGSEFKKQLSERKIQFISWQGARKTSFDQLQTLFKFNKINYVINAAGYTGSPNIDACELNKSETFYGNVLWPQMLVHFCQINNITLGHVSSGCVYNGKKSDGSGFSEEDEPNFSFRQNNCSFYSGTKAVAENIISKWEKNSIWRLRIPFEEISNNRNYLSKILNYNKLLNAENSISNKQEFVSACIQIILRKTPFGIYNVTNVGYITTEQIVKKMKKTIAKNIDFQFIDEESFYSTLAKTPRSNCILDNSKLLSMGIKMSEVNQSVDYCLNNWRY